MKKFTSFLVCLVLIMGSVIPAFGAETATPASGIIATTTATPVTTIAAPVSAATPVGVPSMDQIVFTGEAIALNLEGVIEHLMTTGTAIELVNINKRSDDAMARGYAESYSNLQTLGSATITTKVTKLTRDFARENLAGNYQADLNSIEKSAVELYYNTLQAQEYYKVQKESLTASQTTLTNVQKKFNLGVASKLDFLTAQNAVTTAKSDVAAALATYNSAKMNFNIKMGYPLMQEVVLSEVLKAPAMPSVSLDAVISSALKTRNEVAGANFAFLLQNTIFTNTKLIATSTSSTYKKQEVQYLLAKQNAEQINAVIEMDVRAKYMDLAQKQLAVAAAESAANLAKEAYRVSQLTYNAGMSTLADLQAAEVTYNKAKIARVSAITDMSVAVYDFEYATSEGTYRIDL